MKFVSLRRSQDCSLTPKCGHRPARKCSLQLEALEERNLLATGLGLVAGLTDSPSALLTTGFYYDLLGRAPAVSEWAPGSAALRVGLTPYQEASTFVSTTEYQAGRIINDYWGLLHRGPGSAEI